ncbi:MAG: hypothetical protein HYY49_08655 [Ignavibacteriales bacterium]|nr:hypothetical protein [Ignavibacteriales bacterium]
MSKIGRLMLGRSFRSIGFDKWNNGFPSLKPSQFRLRPHSQRLRSSVPTKGKREGGKCVESKSRHGTVSLYYFSPLTGVYVAKGRKVTPSTVSGQKK